MTDKEFIDKQFNTMRAELFTAIETLVQDPDLSNRLKIEIRSRTKHIWNGFTSRFSEE